MSPTSSSRLFAGRNARSATLRTIGAVSSSSPAAAPSGRRAAAYVSAGLVPVAMSPNGAIGRRRRRRPVVRWRRFEEGPGEPVRIRRGGRGDPGASPAAAATSAATPAPRRAPTRSPSQRASFPPRASTSPSATALVLTVRNTGDRRSPTSSSPCAASPTAPAARAMPTAAATCGSSTRGPAAAATAFEDTWTAGRLEAGRSATLRWERDAGRRRAPTAPLRDRAGLAGAARAQLAGGGVRARLAARPRDRPAGQGARGSAHRAGRARRVDRGAAGSAIRRELGSSALRCGRPRQGRTREDGERHGIQRRWTTYLNDHLAGATAGMNLAEMAAEEHQSDEHGPFFGEISSEISADYDDAPGAHDVARRRGERDQGRPRRGRLEDDGAEVHRRRATTSSTRSSRCETLSIGVEGKVCMWKALKTVEDD